MLQEIILVSTTIANLHDAEEIASKLLEKHVVACAQITGPIKSLYRWKEAMVSEEEYLLTAKSTSALQKQVVSLISQLHPYELPEIIVQKPDYVFPAYAQWVLGECNGR